jgi:hypothetical protein
MQRRNRFCRREIRIGKIGDEAPDKHSGIDILWAIWVWDSGEKLCLGLEVAGKDKA